MKMVIQSCWIREKDKLREKYPAIFDNFITGDLEVHRKCRTVTGKTWYTDEHYVLIEVTTLEDILSLIDLTDKVIIMPSDIEGVDYEIEIYDDWRE